MVGNGVFASPSLDSTLPFELSLVDCVLECTGRAVFEVSLGVVLVVLRKVEFLVLFLTISSSSFCSVAVAVAVAATSDSAAANGGDERRLSCDAVCAR